jgi:iron complex transport system substrate-binding protein
MNFNRSKIIAAMLLILVGALPWAGAAAEGADFRIEAGPVVFDQGGRRLEVSRPFTRIISLYGAHTENLFAMGCGPQLIGVSPQEDYPPAVREKPVFSYHDDPEKFLAARPDLVLIRPMIDRGYPQLVQRLETSGISVVSLQPGTVGELAVYWEFLGLLAGRREQAAAMNTRFESAVAAIRRLTAAVQPKKKVYFEAIHAKMKTFSPESMAIFALEAAGGVNVAADAQPVRDTNIAFYGKERILTHAAEIEVFLAQSGTMNPVTVELIEAESGFGVIRAVQAVAVHLVDERLVSRPTPRLLEGILEIGNILYPELFRGKTPQDFYGKE